MNLQDLKKDRRYLVDYLTNPDITVLEITQHSEHNINEVKVIDITPTCVKLEYIDKDFIQWLHESDFVSELTINKYHIIQVLSEYEEMPLQIGQS